LTQLYGQVKKMNHINSYRIGVMTHWWTQTNYGQVLQAYALQKYLKGLGHDAYLIRYDLISALKNQSYARIFYKIFSIKSWKTFLKKISQKLKEVITRRKDRENPRHFDEFKKKHLEFSELVYNNFSGLKKNYPFADILIVGSDQVWLDSGHIEPYFLNFGSSSTKRIAYAASFGRDVLSREEIATHENTLAKFNSIGVRESSGIGLCKKLGFNDAVLVPDPTILLDKNEWMTIRETSNYFNRDGFKVFVYMIGGENHNKILKTAYELNHDHNTIYVTSDGYNSKSNAFPSIGEWIDLVERSDFIITNSFHGTVFSLLFNKNFITLTRDGKAAKMNVRTKSFLQRLKLDHRLLEQYNQTRIKEIKEDHINWQSLNQSLDNLRKEGFQFLNSALSN